jgi:hypothetical protein
MLFHFSPHCHIPTNPFHLLPLLSFLRLLTFSLFTSPPGSLDGSGSSSDIFSRKVGQVDRHGKWVVLDGNGDQWWLIKKRWMADMCALISAGSRD